MSWKRVKAYFTNLFTNPDGPVHQQQRRRLDEAEQKIKENQKGLHQAAESLDQERSRARAQTDAIAMMVQEIRGVHVKQNRSGDEGSRRKTG